MSEFSLLVNHQIPGQKHDNDILQIPKHHLNYLESPCVMISTYS